MAIALSYLFFLICLQGFLSVMLVPYPPPDLFFVFVISLLWRLPAWRLVLVAYLVGLLQDIIGAGYISLHAITLAAAALVANAVASQLAQRGVLANVVIISSAMLAKWLMFCLLILWLANLEPFHQLLRVAPFEFVSSFIACTIFLPFSDWLFRRYDIFRKEYH